MDAYVDNFKANGTAAEEMERSFLAAPYPVEKLDCYFTDAAERAKFLARVQGAPAWVVPCESAGVEGNATGVDKGSGLQATVDFGDGITETLPLDTAHDYLYDVGNYVVHLQVKDGAIAFLDSQCPDHVCEQFDWLSEQDAWAACVPAGVYVTVQAAETE